MALLDAQIGLRARRKGTTAESVGGGIDPARGIRSRWQRTRAELEGEAEDRVGHVDATVVVGVLSIETNRRDNGGA